jgi:hypothetical protein
VTPISGDQANGGIAMPGRLNVFFMVLMARWSCALRSVVAPPMPTLRFQHCYAKNRTTRLATKTFPRSRRLSENNSTRSFWRTPRLTMCRSLRRIGTRGISIGSLA